MLELIYSRRSNQHAIDFHSDNARTNSPYDMLISHCLVVLTSAAVMNWGSGNGAGSEPYLTRVYSIYTALDHKCWARQQENHRATITAMRKYYFRWRCTPKRTNSPTECERETNKFIPNKKDLEGHAFVRCEPCQRRSTRVLMG